MPTCQSPSFLALLDLLTIEELLLRLQCAFFFYLVISNDVWSLMSYSHRYHSSVVTVIQILHSHAALISNCPEAI
jgi:hypothetical protein